DDRDEVSQRQREALDRGVGYLWMLADEVMQLFLAENVDHTWLHRGGAGRVWTAIQRGHVVEGLARAKQTQDLLASRCGGAVDLDEAGPHVVKTVATRALEQDDALARDLLLAHEARDSRQVGGTERGEEIDLANAGWRNRHSAPSSIA